MSQEFERFDGQKTEVDICHCPACKNYFWAATEQLRIELPAFCCWCGFRFTGFRRISGQESNDMIP